MNHFTDRGGYNGIRSQPTWRFRASTPPGDHPHGAYFTTLGPQDRSLAARLRIPRSKLAFVFTFHGADGLRPLDGGRGSFIFYSPEDYDVDPSRQISHGPTET